MAGTGPLSSAQIDVRKPLVWQVAQLGDAVDYGEWVHAPDTELAHGERPRLFASPLLERLSHTHPATVPAIWVPVALYLVAGHYRDVGASATLVTTLAAGLLMWSGLEYFLHRFAFHFNEWLHQRVSGRLLALHFLIHGVHHKFPLDGSRLVMPPAAAIPLMTAVWAAARAVLVNACGMGPARYAAVYGAGMLGYVAYDLTHYALHHVGATPGSTFAWLKRYHLRHHFAGAHGTAFGVTSPVWDWAFGTALPTPPARGKAA